MQKLQLEYAAILKAHLAEPNEANLFKGYSFGRMCSQQGVAMADVVAMHFDALKSGLVEHTDANLPDSQALLLETTLAMSVSGGLKTMEHVLAALYDETIEQYKELRRLKGELEEYSCTLEEKVEGKLKELQASEERFAVLVQTIPDIVYKIDRKGRFAYLNDAVRQLGYEPDELIGRHFTELILPSEVELVCSTFVLPRYEGRITGSAKAPKLFDERRSGSRMTSGLEVRLVLKTGRTVPGLVEPLSRELVVVEVSSSGLHEYNPATQRKEYIGTVGVIRDITERKRHESEISKYHLQLEEMVEERTLELSRANQALQAEIADRERSEKFVKNILEAMEEGLLVVDPELRIMAANRAYAARMNRPVHEIIGRPCHLISHRSERPCHELGRPCSVKQVLETGRSHEVIWTAPNSGGQKTELLIKAHPMRDAEGAVTSVIMIINDLTVQRRLEDQLRQAQKMEAVGTLAGGIAHDFNNILGAIIGYAQLASQEVPKESRPRLDLEEVLKAADRAKELVKQILTFSRQAVQEKTVLSVAPIIRDGLKLLRASLPSTIEIRSRIAEDLQPVNADPTQIHQVLVNLCANAAQAMGEECGDIEIELCQVDVDSEEASQMADLRPGPHVRLSVRDTGVGMSRAVVKRIFDPYFTTKEKEKGTGLGLAVVHGIVKSHHGAIRVESEPGRGSVFHVYLPVVLAPLPEQTEKTRRNLPVGRETILLVEDEAALLRMIERLLKNLGYRVVPCRDSLEALEVFSRDPHQFDLVLTDLTMPKMAGDALAERILAERPEMPVILCTGYSERISVEQALERGVRRLIYKPVELSELAGIVRDTLDGSKN